MVAWRYATESPILFPESDFPSGKIHRRMCATFAEMLCYMAAVVGNRVLHLPQVIERRVGAHAGLRYFSFFSAGGSSELGFLLVAERLATYPQK